MLQQYHMFYIKEGTFYINYSPKKTKSNSSNIMRNNSVLKISTSCTPARITHSVRFIYIHSQCISHEIAIVLLALWES